MKTKIAVLALGFLLGGAAIARQVIPDSVNSSARSNEVWDVPVVADDSSSAEDAVVVSKAQVATRPFKFEKSDSQSTRRIEPGARAWTTLVGWRPGTSAFPDPMTHESRLVLFTLHDNRQR